MTLRSLFNNQRYIDCQGFSAILLNIFAWVFERKPGSCYLCGNIRWEFEAGLSLFFERFWQRNSKKPFMVDIFFVATRDCLDKCRSLLNVIKAIKFFRFSPPADVVYTLSKERPSIREKKKKELEGCFVFLIKRRILRMKFSLELRDFVESVKLMSKTPSSASILLPWQKLISPYCVKNVDLFSKSMSDCFEN